MSEIKTPLTYEDTQDMWEDALIQAQRYGTAVIVSAIGPTVLRHLCLNVIGALMAVDVASREQERERCAQLVEDSAHVATAYETAGTIRNPEAIPRERPGLLEQLQASLGIEKS